MNVQTSFRAAGLAALVVLAGPAGAQSSGRADGLRLVPHVVEQFKALTELADPLGFHRSTTPNPSQCRHYQAITRVDGADGTPFFLVTRSGNTPDIPVLPDELVCDDSPGETRNGNLVVFRMGSRDKNGERLRSNRLKKGVHVDDTEPPAEDVATIFFTVVGGDPNDPDPARRPGLVFRNGEGPGPVQRVYGHPGGMQLVGHMLAIANESPKRPTIPNPDSTPEHPLPPIPDPSYDVAPHPTAILFFDVSDPEAPVFRSQFAPMDRPAYDPQRKPLQGADGLGVTPLENGLYLMAVKGGFEDHDPIYFYRSTIGDLSSPDLDWEFVSSTRVPEVEDPHQTFQFLRETGPNGELGDLFMAGARGNPVFGDHDRIDLFHVDRQTTDCAPGDDIQLTMLVHGKRISPFPSTGGSDKLANTAAATGFYVSPSGELIFYATEHDNDGPNGTVKAGEWRHRDVVREGSPTLLPAAQVDGPFEVDEGRTTTLTGTAKAPVTQAWIQLYAGTDFKSLYPTIDFADVDLDDFDDFSRLERQVIPRPAPDPPIAFDFADLPRSWKWYAPAGCSIFAIDHVGPEIDEARTLIGDGTEHQDPDLAFVLNDGGTDDVDQEIDAVQFLPDCTAYYATPTALRWDLDRNGSYETSGTAVTLSALALDGPTDVVVPAEAQHPTGGPVGLATANVHVNNVAPQLSPVRIADGAGRQVGVDVPFVLTRVPVTATATFTDPGVLDHQSATMAWGDGTTDAQATFLTFDEAFGDATGALSARHRYLAAGALSVGVTVTDDDGGVGNLAASVRVVTPQQAVEEIVPLLDAVIQGAPSGRIAGDLQKARKALVGNPNGQNGALDKIKAGNDAAAIAFLRQAVTWIERAQGDGLTDPRAALLIGLLEQVQASLAAN